MGNPLSEQLNSMARALRVEMDTSASEARKFRAQLIMPTDQGQRPLPLVETVEGIVTREVSFNLNWLTKDIRFINTNIDDLRNVGGMPIGDVLNFDLENTPPTTPLGTTSLLGKLAGKVTSGSTTMPIPPEQQLPRDPSSTAGVPGLLGKLTGAVNIPIQETTTVTHVVGAEVEWRIMRDGQIDSDVRWSVDPGMRETGEVIPGISGGGGVIRPGPELALQALHVDFPHAFVELTKDTASRPLVQRTIHARVRLLARAIGITSEWIDLPPIPVSFPVTPVPTALLMFQRTEFGGFTLALVPGNSLVDNPAALRTALMTLGGAVSDLMSPPLMTALMTLPMSLSTDPAFLQFRMANEIGNLKGVVFKKEGEIIIVSGEDSMGSLIFIGPPRRQVQCFNAREFIVGQGQMNVTIGPELAVIVSSLNSAAPASTPPGRVGVPFTPAGQRTTQTNAFHNIVSFANEISSVRFAWE